VKLAVVEEIPILIDAIHKAAKNAKLRLSYLFVRKSGCTVGRLCEIVKGCAHFYRLNLIMSRRSVEANAIPNFENRIQATPEANLLAILSHIAGARGGSTAGTDN
jgi:hypothetical protein